MPIRKQIDQNKKTYTPSLLTKLRRDTKTPTQCRCFCGGGSLTRLEPETKGLVKKRMTIDEYLEHQSEEEMADSKRISGIYSEMEVWFRVHWRLSEELFLFWYIWLKDNLGMVEEFVEEVKATSVIDQT